MASMAGLAHELVEPRGARLEWVWSGGLGGTGGGLAWTDPHAPGRDRGRARAAVCANLASVVEHGVRTPRRGGSGDGVCGHTSAVLECPSNVASFSWNHAAVGFGGGL